MDTTLTVNPVKENTFLGIIYLKPSTKQLPEVTIKSQAIKSEFDRKEYIITDRMRKQAVTTTDLLKQLPEIQYDPFRDRIMVQGKMKVLYLVNGIEKPLEYVKSISPKRILKIEIYRNPVGRYALEGYDAVINIILRDDYIGFELSTYTFSGITTSKKYIVGSMPFNYGAVNLSFVRYKTTARLSFYSWKYELQSKEYDSLIVNNLPIWAQEPINDNWNSLNKGWGYTLYGGIDWRPSVNHTLTFDLVRTGVFKPNYSYSNFETLWRNATFTTQNTSESMPISNKAVITHQWQLGYKSKLQSQLSLEKDNAESTYIYEELHLADTLRIVQRQTSQNIRLKAYSEWDGYIIKDRLSLLAGIIYTYDKQQATLTTQLNDIFSIDPSQVVVTTNSIKPYAFLTWKMHPKIKLRFGTGTNYLTFAVNDSVADNFLYFEPRVDINWSISKMANFSILFRTDVESPSGSNLLNAQTIKNRTFISIGNQDLRPYTTYTLEATLDVFGGAFSLTPYYRWSNNEIETIWELIDDSIMISRPVQGVSKRRVGIRFSLPIPLYKQYLIGMVFGDYSMLSLKWQDLSNKGSIFKIWVAILYNNNEKGLTAGVGINNLVVPYPTLQGIKNFGDVDMGDFIGVFVQKTLFQRRLSIMLFYTPPVSFPPIDQTFFAVFSGSNWRSSQRMYSPYMQGILGININFNLSKGRIIKNRQKPEGGRGFKFGF